MNQNKAAKKYALVVGIDRSDKSLSVCELRNGRPEPAHTISTDPAKLLAWWEGRGVPPMRKVMEDKKAVSYAYNTGRARGDACPYLCTLRRGD